MKEVLVILVIIRLVQTFNLKYYDCTDIDRLHQLDGNSAFHPQFKTNLRLKQKVNIYNVKGCSCEEVQSVFYFTCGVWGHHKLWRLPNIEIQQPVTP